MNRKTSDSLASVIFDRESADRGEETQASAEVAKQIDDFSQISDLLRVPADVAREDPFFVVRFRQRRDEMLASLRAVPPWRWVALRLIPIAVSAVVTAAAVLWISDDRIDPLVQLERLAVGDGVDDVTLESTEVEPVLRIAMGDL